MINSTNIKGYINFLHLKKYNAPATEELLSRWAMLSDREVQAQLQGLYQHWGIDAVLGRNYEQEFNQAQTAAQVRPVSQPPSSLPQEPVQPVAYNYTEPKPKGSKSTLYVAVILVLALVCAFLFYKMNKKEDTSAEQQPAAARTTEQVSVPQTATAPAKPVVLEETEEDEVNMGVVRNLMQAEEAKDIGAILNCFSPDMQQYWDISYPSQEELTRRYNSVWEKSADGKHLNARLKKSGEDTYDMFADYEFFSIKDQVTKTVKAHVRYVFDKNNKIVKTYNVK
jgi:hypothetical protein